MKLRLLLFLKYYLFWYLFFVFSKFLFLFGHFKQAKVLAAVDWFRIIFHGFRLDLSTASYLMVVPGIILIITALLKPNWLYKSLNIYTIIMLVAVVFLTISDLVLFNFWGFRLDSTPLLYMENPGEMLASVSLMTILLLLAWIILLTWLFYRIYKIWIAADLKEADKSGWSMLVFPVITAALIVPVRGGFGVESVNVSTAYFHTNNFANQAAINCIWNLGYSLSELGNLKNKYDFVEPKEAKEIIDSLYTEQGITRKVIRNPHPNIILIAVESFTAKVIGSLGGMKGITPRFDQLVHEGILFDHFYASGDRTDKALVALDGSFPSLPTTNIIKYPYKLAKLDFLTNILKSKGYRLNFFYGGNAEFANYGTLLNLAGFEHIVSISDFGGHRHDSKWGAWDHIVLDKVLKDTKDDGLFFNLVFTLTSHPPYEIPSKPMLPGNDADTKFLNAVHYTDSCLGVFIDKAKNTKWWNNTLIILVADHGVPLPGNTPNFAPEKFHIPMLWLGGVLGVKDTVVHTLAVQTDIACTILRQLNLNNKVPYSRNIFSRRTGSFAYYTFNNGFGYLTDADTVIYDGNVQKFLINNGHRNQADCITGKAYLQFSYEDFLQK